MNAPRNPTINARRKLSPKANFSVNKVSINPIRNEPMTFIKNVGNGNFANKPASGEIFIKYLATAPNAPPIATRRIFAAVSILFSSDFSEKKIFHYTFFANINHLRGFGLQAKLFSMAERLAFSKTSDRKLIYNEIAPQIEALISGESDTVANLANVAAVLKEAFGFFWVGFYVVKENQLVLSAFQGSVACTRIDFDKGVCGHCYTTRETVIVPDVDEFPGHIACSSASKSEIVLPVFEKSGEVFAVLDVDSDKLNDFSQTDAEGLRKIVEIFERQMFGNGA